MRQPAVAVELLRKARRHTPFARPATVRGRVSGRIGPLGTWIAAVRAGGIIRVWAVRTGRAQSPSPRPVEPNSGGSPDSAARPAVATWRNHHVVIEGSCAAQDQRWNGQIAPPRPIRQPP
eukprot:scaffold39412_cov42-Phaeocystis_antarctica.AAC.2